jgi:hypothetical protein
MQNSTVETGRNAGEPVPNPTGAVPQTSTPQRSPPPAPWGSDVAPPDRGVEQLPNPGDPGRVSPMSSGIPGGSPRPAGETEGQGTSTTAGGAGTDLGGPGRDAC